MDEVTDIGIPFRPIVTQISRWDRLKGFEPLLEAFVRLKQSLPERSLSERHRRRLDNRIERPVTDEHDLQRANQSVVP